ncbi:hypothetical protein AB0M32_39745 [Streptomyces sp. NPDC051985]|uniref:hypothetical protein n=1 Tax=Streptomyces sp. NPDC051985 TaxID=3155807 RepID=UPI003432808A
MHDPAEVTVQNDVGAVRIRPGAADGSDAPVFVDASGRRSRRFRRLGMAVALACAVYAVVIVVTLLSGSSDAPWLPVPGQDADQPAGQVHDSPRPGRSGRSADDGSSVAGPVAGAGTTPTAGVSSRATGTGGPAVRPSPSSDVRPTASAGATAGAVASPQPGSSSGSTPPSSAAPSPDTPASPASSPPASPSESAAPTGGPVAEGAGPRTAAGAGPSAAPVL